MVRIDNIDIKGKRVLIRTDFNIPIDNGKITSDFRITKTLDTINYCLDNNAKIILMSHLGRPKGQDESLSLFPVYKYLKSFFNDKNVFFSKDCISDFSIKLTKKMQNTDIHILENLRFYDAELSNSNEFSEKLSKHGDVYINEAFGTSHRRHASNASILKFFKTKGIGFLLDSELKYLSNLDLSSGKKISIVLGGAKVSSKLGVIKYFLDRADSILIGGAMAYTFLKVKGIKVGKSLVEKQMLDEAAFILNRAKDHNTEILLPLDVICSKSTNDISCISMKDINDIGDNEMGVDIGEKTIDYFSQVITASDSIIWNGPMGIFEIPSFAIGTKKIAKNIAEHTKKKSIDSIIGGGDTASAIINLNMQSEFTHISTGGGASLELLSGKKLALIKSWENYE